MDRLCRCRKHAHTDLWVLCSAAPGDVPPAPALRCAKCGGAVPASDRIVVTHFGHRKASFDISDEAMARPGVLGAIAKAVAWRPKGTAMWVSSDGLALAGCTELMAFPRLAPELKEWDRLASRPSGEANFYSDWAAATGRSGKGTWGTLNGEHEADRAGECLLNACKVFGIWCALSEGAKAPGRIPSRRSTTAALTRLCHAVTPHGNFAAGEAYPVGETGDYTVEIEVGRQGPNAWQSKAEERSFRIYLYGHGVEVEPEAMVLANVPASRRSTRLRFQVRPQSNQPDPSLYVDVMGCFADFHSISLALHT